MDQVLGFGAFTNTSFPAVPSFPGASAIVSQASPFWSNGHGFLDRTSAQSDPAGGSNAERYLSNAAGPKAHSEYSLGGFTVSQPGSATYPAASTITVSVFAKSIGTTARYLRLNLYDVSTIGADAGCMFDLQGGAPGSYRSGGATESNAGMTNYGDGWWQCWFSCPTILSGDIVSHQVGISDVDGGGNFDYSPVNVAIGDGFYLFRYQIVTGTNPNG